MLHQIGIGTLGPVFRTYEPTRDRLVAVKVFRLDIVPEQAAALAAALGRAVHASLFHPSIVEPLEAGMEGTLAYRAEEYVAAESLDVAMRHYAPAPIEKVLPFITQLAGAVDFARAAGIGHGGLHPRDIFVTPDEARATGFGVVEALEQVGIRAPIRRPYSAPERIDGSAWSTPADVFSLAAITFELLTGKRPAGTGTRIGELGDHAHADALHRVLARAMDDQPDQRYGSALAFAAALEAASQGKSPAGDVRGVVAAPEAREPAAIPLVLETPAVEPMLEASMDVHEPEPLAPEDHEEDEDHEDGDREDDLEAGEDAAGAAIVAGTAGTPGEFEVEAQLDPVHEALADAEDAEASGEASLFSDLDEVTAAPVTSEDTFAEPAAPRFADDFVDEQEAEADLRSPLEDEPLAPPMAVPVERAMFQAGEADVDLDGVDRPRPAILPVALVALPALLVGFAAGYFMGNRERVATPQEIVQSAPAASTASPATADTPGNYSEQPVTPPASAAAPSETAAASSTTAPSAAAAGAPVEPAAPRPRPVAETGRIVVRSTPSRAGVTVNGTWRGRTPLTLDGLRFGSYVVRVVQPGYVVAREEFSLDADAPARNVTVRLERAGRAAPATAAPPARTTPAAPVAFVGSLYVDSRPRGATVLVDGRDAGRTPLSIPELAIGMHVVKIEMDGKKPVTATPRIVAGQTERVTVTLEDRQ